jgi:hypothetical protein
MKISSPKAINWTLKQYGYIIIWLSPYVPFLRSLSPPKPAGLDFPNFRWHNPNWMWKRDSQKKFKNKNHGKFSEFFF